MRKKSLIYIGIVFIVFAGGFFSGGIGPGKRADSNQERADRIQGQFETISKVNGSLNEENQRLADAVSGLESKNTELEQLVGELQDINDQFNLVFIGISDANSDTRQGIKAAETGIDSAIGRLDKLIEEAEKKKPDNNS